MNVKKNSRSPLARARRAAEERDASCAQPATAPAAPAATADQVGQVGQVGDIVALSSQAGDVFREECGCDTEFDKQVQYVGALRAKLAVEESKLRHRYRAVLQAIHELRSTGRDDSQHYDRGIRALCDTMRPELSKRFGLGKAKSWSDLQRHGGSDEDIYKCLRAIPGQSWNEKHCFEFEFDLGAPDGDDEALIQRPSGQSEGVRVVAGRANLIAEVRRVMGIPLRAGAGKVTKMKSPPAPPAPAKKKKQQRAARGGSATKISNSVISNSVISAKAAKAKKSAGKLPKQATVEPVAAATSPVFDGGQTLESILARGAKSSKDIGALLGISTGAAGAMLRRRVKKGLVAKVGELYELATRVEPELADDAVDDEPARKGFVVHTDKSRAEDAELNAGFEAVLRRRGKSRNLFRTETNLFRTETNLFRTETNLFRTETAGVAVIDEDSAALESLRDEREYDEQQALLGKPK